MWLDDLDSFEWSEGGGAESSVEQPSEKQREKTAKALAGIKRTRKDEGKARRDDDFLYEILCEIIASGKADALLISAAPLFENNTPSNFIVGVFSLVYPRASNIIRTHYKKEGLAWQQVQLVEFHYKRTLEPVEFDENNLDIIIRNRINEWIEDLFSVISYDPSIILTKQFQELLTSKHKRDLVHFMAETLIFFFRVINIRISETKASVYADFILNQVKKRVDSVAVEDF